MTLSEQPGDRSRENQELLFIYTTCYMAYYVLYKSSQNEMTENNTSINCNVSVVTHCDQFGPVSVVQPF